MARDSTKMEDWLVFIIKGGATGKKRKKYRQYFEILTLKYTAAQSAKTPKAAAADASIIHLLRRKKKKMPDVSSFELCQRILEILCHISWSLPS